MGASELVVEWSVGGYTLTTLFLSVIKENKWIAVTLTDTSNRYAADKAEMLKIAYSLQFEQPEAE